MSDQRSILYMGVRDVLSGHHLFLLGIMQFLLLVDPFFTSLYSGEDLQICCLLDFSPFLMGSLTTEASVQRRSTARNAAR